ncbi:hypothetical protein [Helicobacter ailurogastricus]|uniref:Lipoprotein n=1 Tax=Helicobacter ailurogastricus TaxID=1578720 RepID=A0A0K2X898_9HELI|nr:hypothetical protein [Helicobacter ailurogastricus]CRF41354.1 hypothetical protein HAL011_11480 [Helicobacter ailurogastricus]CRF42029.1 hypothetical protein HAL013_01780 [Helicobacter ailurogastricus]CRF43605.1 hypothetical protein HAL09_01510 [Helicobacter ailurogastricus]
MKKFSLLLVLSLGACVPKPSANASLVTFDIAHQGGVVKTYWRKLGDKPSKEFALGSNNWVLLIFKDPYKKAKIEQRYLEPGIYYLASFELQVGDRLLKSQGTLPRWRTGWDKAHNKPLFLAFKVKPHTPLKLPPIELAVRHILADKKRGVKESYKVNFLFNDKEGVLIQGAYLKSF